MASGAEDHDYLRRISILVATEWEFKGVQRAIPPEEPDHDLDSYAVTSAISEKHPDAKVVVQVSMIGKGPASAACNTARVLLSFRPTDVLVVGAAGGLSSSDIGDALLATQIVDVTAGEVGRAGIETHIKGHTPSHVWIRAVQDVEPEWRGALTHPGRRRQPLLHCGLIASGPNIISHPTYVQELRLKYPKLLGFEMEAAGVMAAMVAMEGQLGQPQWAVLKAVSDFADEPGNSGDRSENIIRVAESAADLCWLAIQRFGRDALSRDQAILIPAAPPSYAGTLDDLDFVLPRIESVLSKVDSTEERPAQIKNLALDGVRTLPWLRNYLTVRNTKVGNIEYRMLLLDFRSPAVHRCIGLPHISPNGIRDSLQRVEALNLDLASRGVHIKTRLYRHPLPMHGFSLDGDYVLIGGSVFRSERRGVGERPSLRGATFPYREIDRSRSTPEEEHLFELFDSWFDYLWEDAVPFISAPASSGLKVIGHRGCRHPKRFEENTIEAIEYALDIGAHGVEVDVRSTKDSVPVLMHDDSVDRTTSGSGEVSGLTWEQVTRLTTPRNRHVPSLQALCELMTRRGGVLALEIKDFDNWQSIVDEAVEITSDSPVELVPSSFHHGVVGEIKKRYPRLRCCAIMDCVPTDPLSMVASTRCDLVSLGHNALSPRIVRQFRRAGVEVWVWTVNSRREAIALHSTGVSGIVTDRPDLILMGGGIGAPAEVEP